MKIKPVITLSSLLFTLPFALPTFADISIEYKNGTREKITENYAKRIELEEGKLSVSIFNFKEKTISSPNDAGKFYMEMSLEDVCNMQKSMEKSQKDAMEAMLKSPKNEHMARVFAQMQAQEQEKVEVINLGASDTISGYKTVKYKIVVDDEIEEIVWLTTDKNIMNELKHMITSFDEFLCGMNNDYQDSTQYKALLQKGFPLKTYHNSAAYDESNNSFGENGYDDGDVEEVVNVNFTRISSNEFAIPDNYKKMTQEELMKKMMSQIPDNQ